MNGLSTKTRSLFSKTVFYNLELCMVQCHVLALDKMISRNLHSSLYGQITIQNRLAVGNRDLILIWVVQASSLHISSVMLFTTTTHHEIFN